MSKVILGRWDNIPHSEKVVRWKRVFRTLDTMTDHVINHHFDMNSWVRNTDCGTVGCAAGHCALDPWFKDRGFGISFTADGKWLGWDTYGPESFFGSYGYNEIFLGSFDDTPAGNQRRPRAIHAAVKRAIVKYITQLSKEASKEA